MAQQKETSVFGKIFTADNNPAPYVNITLLHSGAATETDRNGFFILSNLSLPDDTLLISGVGFQTYKQAVSINNFQNADLGNYSS